jgi:predicted DNA-binding antitoxin AbrB/MazE fold protein
VLNVRAIYRNGCFVPKTPCDLPEGCEVELAVQGPFVLPPSVTDPEEQVRIRRKVLERMLKNPISADAPHFTREQLHERR